MDSSLSRQTNFSLSIIPDRPLHRLTESMTRGLSVVVTSMLPALPTDSWLASQAHRRQKRRAHAGRRNQGRNQADALRHESLQPRGDLHVHVLSSLLAEAQREVRRSNELVRRRGERGDIRKRIKRVGAAHYLRNSSDIKGNNRFSEVERFQDAEPETFVIGCVKSGVGG